jgi:carbon-monoxide dehydrogenase large subunit
MTVSFKGRREDKRLITGQGRYTSDWNLPGQLHGVFLRSDRAHADIIGIDVSAAKAMPGIKAVFTAADLAAAGVKVPEQRMAYPGRGGKLPLKPEFQLLARTKVCYVGHPIALVIADSVFAGEDAAEHIVVDYRDLPVVVDMREAITPGCPAQLYPEIPNNVSFQFDFGDEAAVTAAFDSAPHVAEVTLDNTRIIVNPMEPKTCLAHWREATGDFDLYFPMQGTNFAIGGLIGYFDLPREKFRVTVKDMGGSFGTRAPVYPEYIALMVASRLLGRPVKWVATRSETFLSDFHGRAAIQTGRIAFDDQGRFLALRHDWIIDAGAYPADFGAFAAARNCYNGAIGPYRIPLVYGLTTVPVTNTQPVGAYRGAGRPETAMIIEQLVDAAALKLGLDRFEIRKRNAIPPDQYPYKTPHGPIYDSGDHPGLLAIAEEKSDWKGFEARRAEAAARGKLRGIGCSTYLEQSGTALPEPDQTEIRFTADGYVELYSIAGPQGQGTESIFALIASRELGVPDDRIICKISDPDGPRLMGMGTGGSRVAQIYGTTFTLGSRESVRKGLALAADELEAAAADIEFKDGAYSVAGTDIKLSILDLAKKHVGALNTMTSIAAKPSFPGGAHVVEVEIDPETGIVEIVRYTAVDDFGTLIDETMVEGQLIGGVVQGIGQVLGEHAVYDKDGQLVTGSFMDYIMPRAEMLKKIDIYNHPVPSPNNVLGAKGVGESGAAGGLTTTYSAIMDALRPLGITQMDMPFTPVRVWQAIQQAKR